MKREAGAVRIQKYMRGTLARKWYTEIKISAIVLQTGFRAVAACNKFRYRKQISASTTIQVRGVLVILGKLCFWSLKISRISVFNPYKILICF